MIKHVKVNGFKTLVNFEIDLHPGLNILVGPNGSGKTNIISFFEFLGFLQSMNLADAVNSAGGAGMIFRKIGKKSYESEITAQITGSIKIGYERYLYYKYHFAIKIPDPGESMIFYNQRLILKYRTVDSIEETWLRNVDLDIEQSIDANLRPHLEVHTINENRAEFKAPWVAEKQSKSEITKRINNAFSHRSASDECIFVTIRWFSRSLWNPLNNDLRGGEIYNIEPSKAKIPDDSAKKSGVGKDGSGLYSTLYALNKPQTQRNRDFNIGFFYDSEIVTSNTIADLLKYVKLTNEAIDGLEIINNPFDKQLQIRISISGDNKKTVLPLSFMSDGTVKWIVLLTIILTNRTNFSIEEPENYLHPTMLSELMSIMRTNIKNNRFILMSSHSETLINNAFPDELIVTSFKDGKTLAKRISNASKLSEEIRNTGFGLGYYYIAGSLEHE